MQIMCGSVSILLKITGETSFTSKSTGAQLRRLTATLETQSADQHEEVEGALSGTDDKLVTEPQGNGGQGCQWRASNYSFSFSDSEPELHFHCLELEEAESLSATAVRISDLIIKPYHYKEDWSDEGLCVELKAVIDLGSQDRLFEMRKSGAFWPVVREGVNAEPRTMRIGRCLWSLDDDKIKQEINLVDQSVYEAECGSWFNLGQPFESRAVELLSEKAEQFDVLVHTLVESGNLSESQARTVLDVPELSLERRKRSFLRVTDLDTWAD